MSIAVHLPEELAARLTAESARRGISVEELTAEPLGERLPSTSPDNSALDAFIGSGSSGALVQGDDVLGGLPGAHAEITAMDAAGEAGLTPGQMAVTRPHLPALPGSDRGVGRQARQLYEAADYLVQREAPNQTYIEDLEQEAPIQLVLRGLASALGNLDSASLDQLRTVARADGDALLTVFKGE